MRCRQLPSLTPISKEQHEITGKVTTFLVLYIKLQPDSALQATRGSQSANQKI